MSMAGFAFALGVTAGALTRRTLPAMAATLLSFIATRILFTLWARPHLLPSGHALFSVTQAQGVGFLGTPSSVNIFVGTPTIPNAWASSAELVNRAHHTLDTAQLHSLLVRTCPTMATGLPQNPGAGTTKHAVGLAGGDFETCLLALSHHVQLLVAYQPPSHYWPLQLIETAIFLAAAFALIAATVWRLGRRSVRKSALGRSTEQTADQVAPEPRMDTTRPRAT